MPVIKETRTGVRKAAREVPTDTTLTVLPMTLDAVGNECSEDATPSKVSSLEGAFDAFKPGINFKTTVGEGENETEVVAEIDFKNLKDFDPTSARQREPGKRNDIADLHSEISMLHEMRDRFSSLAVRRAWKDEAQRDEIIAATAKLQEHLRAIAGLAEDDEE